MRIILLLLWSRLVATGLAFSSRTLMEDAISQWEYQQRGRVDPAILPAVRNGLRVIDRFCRNDDDRRQEGMAILIKALRNQHSKLEGNGATFEESVATEVEQQIRSQSWAEAELESSSRIIQLPQNVQAIVAQATQYMRDDPQYSLSEVSDRLNIPRHTLVEYLRLSRSVESPDTVELKTLEYDDDDEAWRRQERIARRRMDAIPDDSTQELEDSIILEELLRTNLSRVLSSTLKPQQLSILRYVYGLETGEPMDVKAVANRLGFREEQVASVLQSAVLRLRHVYEEKYLNTYSMEEETT